MNKQNWDTSQLLKRLQTSLGSAARRGDEGLSFDVHIGQRTPPQSSGRCNIRCLLEHQADRHIARPTSVTHTHTGPFTRGRGANLSTVHGIHGSVYQIGALHLQRRVRKMKADLVQLVQATASEAKGTRLPSRFFIPSRALSSASATSSARRFGNTKGNWLTSLFYAAAPTPFQRVPTAPCLVVGTLIPRAWELRSHTTIRRVHADTTLPFPS